MIPPPAAEPAPPFRSHFTRAFAKPQLQTLWFPLLALLLCEILAMIPYGWHLRRLGEYFMVAYPAAILWFLVLAIGRFLKKRIAGGFAALAGLVLSFISIVPVVLVGFMMDDSGDDFADGLKLPENLELTLPEKNRPFEDATGDPADTFQVAIRAALAVPGSDDASLNVSVPSLEKLRKDHPELLDRYLACHPGWRVYEKRGSRFATRRWMVGDRWQMSLHGYYSSFGEDDGSGFQTRTTIGFSGKPWGNAGQKIHPATSKAVTLERGNEMWQSLVSLSAGDLVIEQFEQSGAKERRISRAAFSELEREFAPLAAQPTWEAARSLLPAGAVIRGKSSLALSDSFQGGIYNAQVRCNPMARGRIYLKAFEITRNFPLSVDRLKTETTEWVGWSDDPEEQFLSETHFTIYEGDWEQYYGARFEVWFKPEGGGVERKLLERDFKIEGWMR